MIIQVLKIFGSIGLFLFGMKIMSEALQKLAGNRMRHYLASFTSNRFKSILTGFIVTVIIQFSGASTVMIVSFVNAGMISLTESMSVIMGANIGTTVKAWFITFLGLRLNLFSLAIPLIGISFPLLFSVNNKRKYVGDFLIGFALILLGLEFIKTGLPDFNTNPEALSFLKTYSQIGFVSVILFIFIGIILTILVQSSSASLALTFVLCAKGWINFDLAGAMVLGENIGTTITANIAAIIANKPAKRAARFHFVSKLLGVLWFVFILHYVLIGIDTILIKIGYQSAFAHVESIPVGLTILHTSFNLINTLLFVGFIPFFIKIVTWMVPEKGEKDEQNSLKHISTGIISTAELSIDETKSMVIFFAQQTSRMFVDVQQLFRETNELKFLNIFDRISQQKNDCNDVYYLLSSHYKLSGNELISKSIDQLLVMQKMTDELKNVTDCCFTIARTLSKKKNEKIWFTQDIRDSINKMFELISEAYNTMVNNISEKQYIKDITKALELENKINELKNELRNEHLKSYDARDYKYQAGVYYNDIISQSEQLGVHILRVSNAINELKDK